MPAWVIIFKKVTTTEQTKKVPDEAGNLVDKVEQVEKKEYVSVLADPAKEPQDVLTAALKMAKEQNLKFKAMELKSSINLPLQI